MYSRYPKHYHAAVTAVIDGSIDRARDKLARSLRLFRADGDRGRAIDLLHHAAWIGFPIRVRPNGRYR